MQKKHKILALVGVAGAGKSTATNYLQEKYGFPKVYFGEITFDKLKQIGWEPTEENQKIIREKIRKELGMGAYAKLSLPKIEKLLKNNAVVLLESLYSWEEYQIIKERYGRAFKTIAICANKETRFARISQRQERALKAWEDLEKRDRAEIEGTNKGGPIAVADYFVFNEGTWQETSVELDKIIKKEGI